ncbi:MAG: MBL fold metallo-hydrolase [Chloroflexi bacterium]|nr:MBL fold metallo-hydrolase [Chloroflexota bacterium]
MKTIDYGFVVPGWLQSHHPRRRDGLTIIDTGIHRKARKKILNDVVSLGKSAGDGKTSILTHSDFDQGGAVSALQKARGACPYASWSKPMPSRREILPGRYSLPASRCGVDYRESTHRAGSRRYLSTHAGNARCRLP